MGETSRGATRLTGRPLDDDGRPATGPALELDPDGRAARLLAESPRALVASPGAGTWATLLERPDEGETERPVLLQWLGPDAAEPPTHYHRVSETFEAVEGTLTVDVDGEVRRLGPGDSVTIGASVDHAFRNETDETVAFWAELPSMRTAASLYTVWGLDVEGAFGGEGDYGEPGLLAALPISEDVYPDTVTTVAPVPVQRALWATVGRAARALGHSGIDERYLDDAFWEERVEQVPVVGD
ncbi:cupin domain-containing protein [Halosimplex marinum]|uniref:cupin domain-containing protein n=1 Tax=Halosimplex marinum TaxID=3396620 RepID=UPI003F54E10D